MCRKLSRTSRILQNSRKFPAHKYYLRENFMHVNWLYPKFAKFIFLSRKFPVLQYSRGAVLHHENAWAFCMHTEQKKSRCSTSSTSGVTSILLLTCVWGTLSYADDGIDRHVLYFHLRGTSVSILLCKLLGQQIIRFNTIVLHLKVRDLHWFSRLWFSRLKIINTC